MQLIITKLCTHIAFCFSTITIFKTELPTCAMFLLPAECKPLWKDTEVSAIQTVTTNGSTWGGGRKRKKKRRRKKIRVLLCVRGQYTVSLAKCVPCTAFLQAGFYPPRKKNPTAISDLLPNETAHLCAPWGTIWRTHVWATFRRGLSLYYEKSKENKTSGINACL